eukprot:TRINITY_DN47756_c0_g1_i2.p1 TRINITY_DN47756_c0_g1~~TRINITY_DN47756_c0_g1_i2.p1  ORF type:complete len:417 (-),score=97.50 TRINITY_DN47756_c0_g1_i2:186-1436(-)
MPRSAPSSLAKLWTCLLLGLPTSSLSSSYYDALGLAKDATAQDVRRQFRKLSVKLHPDKNPEADTPQGRREYQKIMTANEWLSNDDRRQLYDVYGEWESTDDQMRGHRFSKRHSEVQFFRDEPLVRNIKTESEAQKIFGLRAKHTYVMMLYAPWLTSAMEATPVYRRVAQNLHEELGEDGIKFAAVNCESKLQSFCLRYGRLRNQFDLPVVLIVDPTEALIDRYRGRLVAEELGEYIVATDKGIRHVSTLDEAAFHANIGDAGGASKDFWLVFFCSSSEPLCTDLKPVLKRLAFSARHAAKVGLVNCRYQRAADGYDELEPFCADQGVQEVPTLVAYRRGARSDQKGEVIPLLLEERENNPMLAVPLFVLRAMEAVLRLSASPAAAATTAVDAGGEDSDGVGLDEDDSSSGRGEEL